MDPLEEVLAKIARKTEKLQNVEVLQRTVNELEQSEYLEHIPVHEGDDYLVVKRAPMWEGGGLTLNGKPITKERARKEAERRGLKGIRIEKKEK